MQRIADRDVDGEGQRSVSHGGSRRLKCSVARVHGMNGGLEQQVSFDFAQGRLSTHFSQAPHRNRRPVCGDPGNTQVLRLTTPKLKNVWGPVRSG